MTARHITIEIPFLPPKELQGNSRPANHHQKARIAKNWRESGYTYGKYDFDGDKGYLRNISPPIERAEIQYTFYTPNASQCDDHNFIIGMKSFVDGLRDAEVLAEDTSDHVTELKPVFVQCKRGEQKTIVEIWDV